MQYIRRSQDRGQVDIGWLKSQHSFSFGHYYDLQHMGISVLRVINDDVVQPGRGFDTHGHRDMEIISYVIDGALAHKDSEGNEHIVPAGEIQVMSAGRGITHSEYNQSANTSVNFLQIWIVPNQLGLTPQYQQQKMPIDNGMTALVTPDGSNDTLMMHQDVTLSRLILNEGEQYSLFTRQRLGYLHVVKGRVRTDTDEFIAGDAFLLGNNERLRITAAINMEALWFDLPNVEAS